MELYRLINLAYLCVVNGVFAFAGIFLNSVVIISLWKSFQFRKGTSYFMIFVVSCFDLVVVMVAHPTTIASAIDWSTGDNSSKHWSTKESNSFHMADVASFVSSFALPFACSALWLITVDRYIAISRPLFHRTSVTKLRLSALWLQLSCYYLLPGVFGFSKSSKQFITFRH